MRPLLGSDDLRYSKQGNHSSNETKIQKENPLISRRTKSLFVATRNNEQMILRLINQEFVEEHESVLSEIFKNNPTPPKKRSDIKLCPLKYGYVQPGYVLQTIKDEFLKADVADYQIDRVLIDNIAHWEMSGHFIRDDEAFGNILLEFLRRQPMTTMVICGETSPGECSVLQRSIIDNADCVIQFDRKGSKVRGRVVMSHMMMEHQGFFEVKPSAQEIALIPLQPKA